MLIIRKIFTKPILPIRYFFTTQTKFFFSTNNVHLKNRIKQIHDKLITSNKNIKPDKLIKMLYYIHFKSQQIQNTTTNLTQQQITNIIQTLSSQTHTLSHQDLTLLLQTISQFTQYSHYKRNSQFMRLLLKKLNSINVLPLDNRYIFRLLNILQKMQFPIIIINKYVNTVINKNQKNSLKMDKLDILKFFVLILQMKYIHVFAINRFYQVEISNIGVHTPQELVYFYYMYTILEKCLKQKSIYFANKLKLHDIVFNPYAEMTTQQQKTNQQTTHQQNKNTNNTINSNIDVNQVLQQQKQKLKQHSQKLISNIHKQIDIQKLKSDICKYYSFQKYPFETSTALLLSNIPQLRQSLYQYFKQNYKTMGPLQIITLLPTVPQKQRLTIYTDYTNRAIKYLSFYQKLILINAKLRILGIKVKKEELINYLEQCTQISSKQLALITKIMVDNLTSDQQIEIINIIDRIVGPDVNNQDNSNNKQKQKQQNKQKQESSKNNKGKEQDKNKINQ